MEFQRYFRPKLSRNIYGHIYNTSKSIVTSSGGSGSYIGGDYLPAKKNEDGTYVVDLNRVTFNGDVISKKNVVAFGTASSGGTEGDTGTTPTPSTIVIDNLLSHSTEAALSANQGRILNEKIDNLPSGGGEVNLADYYKKTEVNNLLATKSDTEHTHPEYALKTDIPSTGGDVSGKLDKSVWDSAFSINGDTINCKLNFVGNKNISAFGESTGSSSSSSTIIIDNLNSDSAEAALSARQGKILKQLIDSKPSGGGSGNLNGVYTRTEVNDLLAKKSDVGHTHSEYATTTQLVAKADKTWVTQKIAEAQLAGNEVDLTPYAKKTDVSAVDDKVTDLNNLFNENFTSEPNKLTVKKDTFINGNLAVKGNVTAYASDGTVKEFFYNQDAYSAITSTAKDQAVTPHTLNLMKTKLDDEMAKNESILSSFKYYFSTITSTSTLADVTEAIVSLLEDIQREGYSLNNKQIKQ